MHKFSSQWSEEFFNNDFSIQPTVYSAIQLSINLNTMGVSYLLLLIFRYKITVIDLMLSMFFRNEKQLYLIAA